MLISVLHTIGLYPAPVVAAIGCGVQLAPPGFAAFFGEFHWTPLQSVNELVSFEIFKDNIIVI